MSEFEKHLYLILYPNEALVASQLSPEAFGRHYSVGSPRHFQSKVIFAEIDCAYRQEYLAHRRVLKRDGIGKPGIPKRTKFVKSYRVLEHVDFDALRKLYLVTTDGATLGHRARRGARGYRRSRPIARISGNMSVAAAGGLQLESARVRQPYYQGELV